MAGVTQEHVWLDYRLIYSVAQWGGILYAVFMASLLVRFGRAVRRFRQRTPYSQERFANSIGIHRSYMWSIERGRANPSLDVIGRIARGLEIPISRLFEAAEREG
jgi:DNA-binding XRE family transcriptional regulator